MGLTVELDLKFNEGVEGYVWNVKRNPLHVDTKIFQKIEDSERYSGTIQLVPEKSLNLKEGSRQFEKVLQRRTWEITERRIVNNEY